MTYIERVKVLIPRFARVLMTTLMFAIGLVSLVAGTQLLIRGASKLARLFGISPLVTGLIVVAFGTSAPELAVSVRSAWDGQGDIAMGNVVGSKIFNIFGVLGVSSLLAPEAIPVQTAMQSIDLLVMIAVAFSCLPIFLPGIGLSVGKGPCFSFISWLTRPCCYFRHRRMMYWIILVWQ